MKRVQTAWLLPAIGLLCSCENRSAAAENRLAMIEKVGTLREVCAAAKVVADAYLDEGNEEKYKFSHANADSKCLTAQLEGGDLPAQDDVRIKMLSDAANSLDANP